MRMVDADKIIEHLEKVRKESVSLVDVAHIIGFQSVIDAQPTVYDVDKVVEQLKTARDGYSTAQLMTATNDELVKRFIAKEKAMNLAIKIVKAGGTNG